MAIHHTLVKKAAKFGLILNEDGDAIRAFWPNAAIEVFASSAAEAIGQGEAAQRISNAECRIQNYQHDKFLIHVTNADGDYLAGGPYTPKEARVIIEGGTASWVEQPGDAMPTFDDEPNPIPEDDTAPHTDAKIERVNGIAIDGAVAYKEGTSAADCPYSSEEGDDEFEYDNFVRWNEEWDAAADAHEEEDDGKTGSVVAQKYRLKYAEQGHPTHCGDWLAETLNEIVLNKEGVNLELFEAICDLNGVDTSKYKRSGVGWQGRIRMTGRNLMAKRVFLNDGVLILPETINGGKMQAPGDWMQMQRFKMPKADQGAPTIAIASGAK